MRGRTGTDGGSAWAWAHRTCFRKYCNDNVRFVYNVQYLGRVVESRERISIIQRGTHTRAGAVYALQTGYPVDARRGLRPFRFRPTHVSSIHILLLSKYPSAAHKAVRFFCMCMTSTIHRNTEAHPRFIISPPPALARTKHCWGLVPRVQSAGQSQARSQAELTQRVVEGHALLEALVVDLTE